MIETIIEKVEVLLIAHDITIDEFVNSYKVMINDRSDKKAKNKTKETIIEKEEENTQEIEVKIEIEKK